MNKNKNFSFIPWKKMISRFFAKLNIYPLHAKNSGNPLVTTTPIMGLNLSLKGWDKLVDVHNN